MAKTLTVPILNEILYLRFYFIFQIRAFHLTKKQGRNVICYQQENLLYQGKLIHHGPEWISHPESRFFYFPRFISWIIGLFFAYEKRVQVIHIVGLGGAPEPKVEGDSVHNKSAYKRLTHNWNTNVVKKSQTFCLEAKDWASFVIQCKHPLKGVDGWIEIEWRNFSNETRDNRHVDGDYMTSWKRAILLLV